MRSYFPVSNDQLDEIKVTEIKSISLNICTPPSWHLSAHATWNSQPLFPSDDFVKNEVFNVFWRLCPI